MATTRLLDREEYIEQAYFFRVLRERLATGMAIQEVLERVDQEILSTTRLPMAIQFLAAEVKHSGLLSSGFTRLTHYFSPFQAFIIRGTEKESIRFSADLGLLVLERQAEYLAGTPTPSGLFVYQFETLCRNRLGYDEGLNCIGADPLFDADWRAYATDVKHRVGLIDFADLIYQRSHFHTIEQRRSDPDYEPRLPTLFGEKDGKIAWANRGRDPLYLFAALQRQLSYPEVPRPRAKDDPLSLLAVLQAKVRDLEMRFKLIESEARGQVDLSQLGRPDLMKSDDPEIDIG